MGKYEVEIQGDKLQVIVIDHPNLIESHVNELKTLLRRRRVAGLDVKFHPRSSKKAEMLILCVGNRCLIIQVGHLGFFPDSLKKFVADETICFVGMEMNAKVKSIGRCSLRCKTGVELGSLAARVLKKPHISSFGLGKLGREVGIHDAVDSRLIIGSADSAPSWKARAFSNEQIKFLIREAYTYYLIGNQVLSTIDA